MMRRGMLPPLSSSSSKETLSGGASLREIRDTYGFAVRPQHLKRYHEHANIYKEEEVERTEGWEQFLRLHCSNEGPEAEAVQANASDEESRVAIGVDGASRDVHANADGIGATFAPYLGSLSAIEQALRKARKRRVSKEPGLAALLGEDEGEVKAGSEPVLSGNGEDEESEDEFYDVERTDVVQDGGDQGTGELQDVSPWAEELKILVCGGVPVALRGELWQVFVGAKDRRVDGHYQTLLSSQGGEEVIVESVLSTASDSSAANQQLSLKPQPSEKWTSQIEKDLPRTFPGHPALDEEGLNALRRMLTAYARHNPAVGYCQAMNFLAALLLLLMPEENAFWTLTAIIDDYFEGYYSEKMVEAQVDQLVFEELVRERFPRLASHLENLGVQVAWVSGPWFLSIYVNVLPWETVLRVWDVLLYEGDRSMLFRTGLALMEIHAGALMQQRDTGDVVAMLQSMGEATFDSSQLVLSACLGFQAIQEKLLQDLRTKHRPAVLAALHERSMELHLWRTANGTISKHGPIGVPNGMVSMESPLTTDDFRSSLKPPADKHIASKSRTHVQDEEVDEEDEDEEIESVDLQEQVSWLKTELCRALEVGKAAALRAEELETAFMEMVQEDNRRLLSAKVEKLEAEVAQLKQILSDKREQEAAMVQVLVRMEQEQHVAEDARRFAEQEAEAHRCAADEAEKTAEKAGEALAAMEKRAVMAESMLEATLNFQSGGGPQAARRGMEIDSGSKGIARSHSSPASKQDADSAWARRHSTGKLEGAEEMQSNVSSKPSIFGRPFSLSWRDKSKLQVETKSTQSDNLKAGDTASPGLSPSPSGQPVLGLVNGLDHSVEESASELRENPRDQLLSVASENKKSGSVTAD